MLTMLLVLAAATAGQQGWYTFEPEAKNFRVQLPSKPDRSSGRTVNNAAGRSQRTVAELNRGSATYSVQVNEASDTIDAATLDAGIKQYAAANQATVGSVATVRVDGNPGREFQLLEGQKRSKMRWVVAGNSLYILTVAASPGGKLPADADRFLGSLEIGPPKVAAATPPPQPVPPPRAAAPRESAFTGAPAAEEPTPDAKPAQKDSNSKNSAPLKFTISRIPKNAKPYLPQLLEDLSQSYAERERDGFRDVGPEGSYLVGVRVSYIERFGGPKISSAQPIFRSGKTHYLGQVYGSVNGPLVTVYAKSGYAVGGLVTNTGLTVDGFGIVFMKVDGDRLDPDDTYKSPWLGDKQGGSPRDVMTKGGLIVGIQGRASKEVNALSLTMLRER